MNNKSILKIVFQTVIFLLPFGLLVRLTYFADYIYELTFYDFVASVAIFIGGVIIILINLTKLALRMKLDKSLRKKINMWLLARDIINSISYIVIGGIMAVGIYFV